MSKIGRNIQHLNSFSTLIVDLRLPSLKFTSIFHWAGIAEDVSINLSNESSEFCNLPYAIERRCVEADGSMKLMDQSLFVVLILRLRSPGLSKSLPRLPKIKEI